jgi:hypothetical protein
MIEKYTRKQIAKIVNIPDRRVEFYTNQGIFTRMEKKVGRGVARLYSKQNVFELFITKKLRLNGIDIPKIKEILKKLETYMLYKRMFDEYGNMDIQGTKLVVKNTMRLFLMVIDWSKVHIMLYGTKVRGVNKDDLDMTQVHDCILIINLTDVVKSINNL